MNKKKPRLLFFVTEDWYFCSHRLPLAIAAKNEGYDVTVLTRVRAHGDIIRAAGLGLVHFEISRRGMNPIAELVTVSRLAALYRKLRPDIVHNVALKPVIYGSLAARLAKVPHVVNALAGLGWLFTATSLRARIVRRAVEAVMPMLLNRGAIIVQNPDNAALLCALGVGKERIRIVRGSGVDTSIYYPEPEPDGIPIVLLPARMLWAKGVGEFVAAAKQLRANGIRARFVLAGDPDIGSPSTVSTAQLEQWHSEGAIEWWGHRQDMPNVLRQAHIVCLPSYYGEGIPKSLLEAAAAGRPIVTTNVSGCRDVVKNGENGLLVPARNSKALAAALSKLLSDPELRQRLGVRGRGRAISEFDSTTVVSATVTLYRELQSQSS